MLDISLDTENYLSLLPTLKSNPYIIGKIVLKVRELFNSISKILEKDIGARIIHKENTDAGPALLQCFSTAKSALSPFY